jgi:hypothetical protein
MLNAVRLLNFLLVGLHSVVLFAGFAPYDAKEQDRNLPYPPTSLHFNGVSGFHFRPFVYAEVSDSNGYREDRTRSILVCSKGSPFPA